MQRSDVVAPLRAHVVDAHQPGLDHGVEQYRDEDVVVGVDHVGEDAGSAQRHHGRGEAFRVVGRGRAVEGEPKVGLEFAGLALAELRAQCRPDLPGECRKLSEFAQCQDVRFSLFHNKNATITTECRLYLQI